MPVRLGGDVDRSSIRRECGILTTTQLVSASIAASRRSLSVCADSSGKPYRHIIRESAIVGQGSHNADGVGGRIAFCAWSHGLPC